MRAAQQAGYKITLVYVGRGSADLSMERVIRRVANGGHRVPVGDIDRRYPASLAKLVMGLRLADRSYVFDNSNVRRRLLLMREDGDSRYVAADLSAWAQRVLRDAGVI